MYGENAFCRLVIDDTTGCYERAWCYGSGDPVFGRKVTLFITQEFVLLKHEIRSDSAVFWHGRSIPSESISRALAVSPSWPPGAFAEASGGQAGLTSELLRRIID